MREAMLRRAPDPFPPLPDLDAAARLWAAGRGLPMGDAVAHGLTVDLVSHATPLSPAILARLPSGSPVLVALTPREREVLALLCERRTNAEMADQPVSQPAHRRRPRRPSSWASSASPTAVKRQPWPPVPGSSPATRAPERLIGAVQSRIPSRRFYGNRSRCCRRRFRHSEAVRDDPTAPCGEMSNHHGARYVGRHITSTARTRSARVCDAGPARRACHSDRREAAAEHCRPDPCRRRRQRLMRWLCPTGP